MGASVIRRPREIGALDTLLTEAKSFVHSRLRLWVLGLRRWAVVLLCGHKWELVSGCVNVAHLFTGTYSRTLDAKNRVLVPSDLREALDAIDRKGLYLVPTKNCVALWPRSDLEAYAAAQGADPLGNLAFNRAFYSQMIFKTFDGTGRIVFPGTLAERFPDREVLIAGVGRHLEAWHPADFEKFMAQAPLDLG